MAVSLPGSLTRSLLMLLTDGRMHSGERLAQALGVSRAAVWKGIERLRLQGIDIEAVPRRGYRLPDAVELLEERAVRAAIAGDRLDRLRSLSLLFDVDSTSTRLLAMGPPPVGCADVVMSELQHAGRGRRGRPWVAPFGGSIALSLNWSFTDASRAALDRAFRRQHRPVDELVVYRRIAGEPRLELVRGRGDRPGVGTRRRFGHWAQVAERHLVRRPQDGRNPHRGPG